MEHTHHELRLREPLSYRSNQTDAGCQAATYPISPSPLQCELETPLTIYEV
jgi:hypothetical protein